MSNKDQWSVSLDAPAEAPSILITRHSLRISFCMIVTQATHFLKILTIFEDINIISTLDISSQFWRVRCFRNSRCRIYWLAAVSMCSTEKNESLSIIYLSSVRSEKIFMIATRYHRQKYLIFIIRIFNCQSDDTSSLQRANLWSSVIWATLHCGWKYQSALSPSWSLRLLNVGVTPLNVTQWSTVSISSNWCNSDRDCFVMIYYLHDNIPASCSRSYFHAFK